MLNPVSVLTIILSEPLREFNPHCSDVITNNNTFYKMKMNSWCGRGRNIDYVMRYRRRIAEITSVKVGEKEVCMTAEPKTKITDVEKCEKFNPQVTI